MEHNDTDLFVFELQITTEDIQNWTSWDYDTSREWLRSNWGEVTGELDNTFDGLIVSMLGNQ